MCASVVCVCMYAYGGILTAHIACALCSSVIWKRDVSPRSFIYVAYCVWLTSNEVGKRRDTFKIVIEQDLLGLFNKSIGIWCGDESERGNMLQYWIEINVTGEYSCNIQSLITAPYFRWIISPVFLPEFLPFGLLHI